jgi:hypothetical protein
VLVAAAMFSVGCAKNPVGPTTEVVSDFGLPTADSTGAQSIKPGATPMATPPNFNGWSVVSASLISEQYDANEGDIDWLIHFYLPGRSTQPRYYQVAAKNVWGTWTNWSTNGYAMPYGGGQSGSSYHMKFVVGKWKARLLNVNMDKGNWALYYHD